MCVPYFPDLAAAVQPKQPAWLVSRPVYVPVCTLPPACRNRVTCYPEGAIWNALVDDWGLAMWVAESHRAWQALRPDHQERSPPVVTLEACRSIAQARQTQRRRGIIPEAVEGHVEPEVHTPSGPVDSQEQPGESYMVGLGKRLRSGSKGVNQVFLSVGFHLYTNCGANADGAGNPLYTWPDAAMMKGAATGLHLEGVTRDRSASKTASHRMVCRTARADSGRLPRRV